MALRLTSLRAAATLLAFSSLVACSKKSDDTPAPAAPAQGMSWTVDGANVTAAVATGIIVSGDLVVAGGSSTTNTSNNMLLTVPRRTGTFTMTDTTTVSTASYIMAGGAAYDVTSGNMVVTTYAPSTTAGASNVAGTFTFTGKLIGGTTTKTITNGSFNVKY